MNGFERNHDREALITGDRATPLSPDEAADLALLANLLGDQSAWVEPDAGFGDVVARAVAGAARSPENVVPRSGRTDRRAARSRRRRLTASVAAAAAAAAAIAGTLVVAGSGAGP